MTENAVVQMRSPALHWFKMDSEDNYGNEEDDDQPDVQKAHFN